MAGVGTVRASVRGAAGSLAITGAPLTPPGSGGPPSWVWIATAVLAVASLVGAVARVRQRSSGARIAGSAARSTRTPAVEAEPRR